MLVDCGRCGVRSMRESGLRQAGLFCKLILQQPCCSRILPGMSEPVVPPTRPMLLDLDEQQTIDLALAFLLGEVRGC